ncbi:Uncharacterised protein [Moraxella cuniculi]|uniref:Uncharacterized protein n=1 Tax=Moraxella cuniculi TaxID=34061 RepID=A0A448GV86_9GAMM|nr:Uncharacterised protein [Moraxella cuniculi]
MNKAQFGQIDGNDWVEIKKCNQQNVIAGA